MVQEKEKNVVEDQSKRRRANLGLWAVFITQFVSFLFINGRNIAQPGMVLDLDGMALFPWLIALPALSGASTTLLFGKLSDMYGRRAILLVSLALFGIGLVLVPLSTTMPLAIASYTFMSLGHWPIVPLCFSTIGDMFPPTERAKWTGMLNLPSGVAALIGPTLGGLITESAWSWRGLYWVTIPLVAIASGLIAVWVTKRVKKGKQKIDILGTGIMLIATTTLIIGFSRLGNVDKTGSGVIILVVSITAWAAFFIVEKNAESPILDPQLLLNRTFSTVAASGFLFFFGSLGIATYSPIFVQHVMAVSPSISGSMLTPYSMLVAFIGIPAGFLLARTNKYKWMYIISYALITLAMFIMWQFNTNTPIWLYVLITSLAGFGMGTIPTINTLVAQIAVSTNLRGVSVGALFFFQMVGIALAPTIMGLVQNSTPDLESGLRLVFLVCAVATMVSLVLVITIPEVSIDSEED
jgi:MFS family permease